MIYLRESDTEILYLILVEYLVFIIIILFINVPHGMRSLIVNVYLLKLIYFTE